MNDTDHVNATKNLDDIGGRAEWRFRDFLHEFENDRRYQFGGKVSFEDYVFDCLECLEGRLTGLEKEMCTRIKWCVGLQQDALLREWDDDEDDEDEGDLT